MHNQGMGDTYFISQFIKGLKPEIRYQVQGQVPATMERAIMLAKIQQSIQGKAGYRTQKSSFHDKPAWLGNARTENRTVASALPMSKERQLRDFCRANNLCFFYKEPYDATHASKCTKRPKAQANALALNELDVMLTEEVLE